MARQKDESPTVSLFPFMSILVCLIGGLTLMISAMMASQATQDQSKEVIKRYEDYQKLKEEAKALAEELKKLRLMIAEAQKTQDELRRAAEEAALLEKEQKQKAELSGARDLQKLLAEANRLRERIAELEKDPAMLQAKIDELKKEVQKRKVGPKEAEVKVRPGGSGTHIVPTFVECAATGVVVHEGPKPTRIRTGDLPKGDGEFRKLLDRVASTPKGEVIFLIRPDGIPTYNVAYSVARSHYGPKGYCKTGRLPIPTQGNLDLSVFKR